MISQQFQVKLPLRQPFIPDVELTNFVSIFWINSIFAQLCCTGANSAMTFYTIFYQTIYKSRLTTWCTFSLTVTIPGQTVSSVRAGIAVGSKSSAGSFLPDKATTAVASKPARHMLNLIFLHWCLCHKVCSTYRHFCAKMWHISLGCVSFC